MSFLESIQHGLEKASQEAARLTKIQHLHNVTTDLTFKASQEGQKLIAQAMELYQSGHLAQAELVAICQQIVTYQQQINEVHEELQRLQSNDENAEQPATPIAAPIAGYPAYAQSAPGAAPAGYPVQYPVYTTPVPPAGYQAYPDASVQPGYQAYPAYPTSPSGEPPTKPGTAKPEVQDAMPLSPSGEPPTKPGTARSEPEVESTPARKKTHAAGIEPTSTAATGSYEDGVLPPVYSPFTAHPAPTGAGEEAQAEPEKPHKEHHSTKKAADEEAEAPASEKKAHKAAEDETEEPVKAKKSHKAAEPEAQA